MSIDTKHIATHLKLSSEKIYPNVRDMYEKRLDFLIRGSFKIKVVEKFFD